jgi:hypothetical protein
MPDILLDLTTGTILPVGDELMLPRCRRKSVAMFAKESRNDMRARSAEMSIDLEVSTRSKRERTMIGVHSSTAVS